MNILVLRIRGDDATTQRVCRRMSSVRQSVEHVFALHYNMFRLFNDSSRFRLLVNGQESIKLIFNSFLLLNCYVCFNESLSNFIIRLPSIEEYLPLDEELPEAPVVPDNLYDGVFSYRYHNIVS